MTLSICIGLSLYRTACPYRRSASKAGDISLEKLVKEPTLSKEPVHWNGNPDRFVEHSGSRSYSRD
jgi:hypothetical protein